MQAALQVTLGRIGMGRCSIGRLHIDRLIVVRTQRDGGAQDGRHVGLRAAWIMTQLSISRSTSVDAMGCMTAAKVYGFLPLTCPILGAMQRGLGRVRRPSLNGTSHGNDAGRRACARGPCPLSRSVEVSLSNWAAVVTRRAHRLP